VRTFDGPDGKLLVEMTPAEALTLNEAIKAAIGARAPLSEDDAKFVANTLWVDWPVAMAHARMPRQAATPQA
jgi:hypothetical protein